MIEFEEMTVLNDTVIPIYKSKIISPKTIIDERYSSTSEPKNIPVINEEFSTTSSPK